MVNRLATEKRALILQLLTEGMGVTATTRIVGCSKNTVLKLLRDAGQACAAYQDENLRNLECRRIQADEIWSFVYAKKTTRTSTPDAGDVWTWVAICEDTKLVPAWWIGDRSYETGILFMEDLAARMSNPIQLTTDGLTTYLDAVNDAFSDWMVEHRVLNRHYPDAKVGRTAYIEGQNLTMRMSMRRYQRTTDAHSKKLVNHAHAVALNCMVYNFVGVHQSLPGRVAPAMAAGVTSRIWTFADIVRLVDGSN
ncbi:MAG: IS1 family transposase [bacterium]|nr:IS1 family transposase [bacterium]